MPVVIPAGPLGPLSATEVYSYAGVNLSTLGVNMQVVEGVDSAPPVRGKNLLIPYQTGTRWVPKYYDERHVVLAGLVGPTSRAGYVTAVDQLKALFPILAGERPLLVQRESDLRYINAEVRNTLGLRRDNKWNGFASPFSIELVASDPIWYGSALEASTPRLAWTLDSGVFLDDGAHWLDQTSQYFALTIVGSAVVEASNAGDTYNRKPIFTLAGAMATPKIINLRNGMTLGLNINPGGNAVTVVDCGAQTVTINGQPQPPNVVTLGPGQTDWMHLEPGDNALNLLLGVIAPVAYQAQYSPAYL
jgi:hypothetical protein